MFCSRCGQAVLAGQPLCTQCGQQAAPAVPGYQVELQGFDSKVRTLAIGWLVYAGLSVIWGIVGLSAARFALSGPLAPFLHPHGGFFIPFPMLMRFAWIGIFFRGALALVAGWGLWERTSWGRTVAIVAAFLSLLKIPLGTAIGIWTLVQLLGYRNSTLYQQSQSD